MVLPDSYGSRELGPQCRVKERRVLARRERVADIVATRRWLGQQPWAARGSRQPDRVGKRGQRRCCGRCGRNSSRNDGPDFRSAIAFYPDCRISSGLGWSARVPTLFLIGAKDDVSSPSACRQMVEGARGRSALTRIEIYPGAAHDFDRANLPLHAIDGSADAACPNAATSAPTPKRASIRKSASRNG